MQIVVLGIDLGKNSCSAVCLDSTGAVINRRRTIATPRPTLSDGSSGNRCPCRRRS
jgi:hypothetical protein